MPIAAKITWIGLQFLLDLNYLSTFLYTPMRYDQEMKGIADASGVDLRRIRRFNLYPELTKAACSIIGAWGPST